MSTIKLTPKIDDVPTRLRFFRIVCIIVTLLSGIFTFVQFSDIKKMYDTFGFKTAPNINTACSIRANLADANRNAINTFLARDLDSASFWSAYEKKITKSHEELLKAAQNITYGDEEIQPLLTLMGKLADYDRLIGMARGKTGKDYLAPLETADRLMRAVIIESAVQLGETNFKHLNDSLQKQHSRFYAYMLLWAIMTFGALAILGGTQIYVTYKFKRFINLGMAISSLVLILFTLYAGFTFFSVQHNLKAIKSNAFDSIYALTSARAIAYDANTDETIFLLDYDHPSMKPRRVADFFEKANLLLQVDKVKGASKRVKDGDKFGGYLGNVIDNVTFEGENKAALSMLNWWEQYMDIDAKVRQLEESGAHKEAVSLNVGLQENQSNWAFEQFDKALGEVLAINQKEFDRMIDKGITQLKYFPFILGGVIIITILGIVIGIRMRLREYTF